MGIPYSARSHAGGNHDSLSANLDAAGGVLDGRLVVVSRSESAHHDEAQAQNQHRQNDPMLPVEVAGSAGYIVDESANVLIHDGQKIVRGGIETQSTKQP